MNRRAELLLVSAISTLVFISVSAGVIVVVGSNNQANQVLADHGLEGLVPPWVDPETGIIDMSKVPDRLPVADGDGGILGYVTVDKNPNDDPEPGDPGFDEWNTTDALYDLEEGGSIIGHLRTGGDGGTNGDAMIFVPLDGAVGPTGNVGDDEELPTPTPGN